MKIVVIGAAGNLGACTVNEALSAGHEVVAYVRRPEAVPPRPHLTIVRGDAADTSTLATAAQGADVVIVSIRGSIKDGGLMQRTLPKIADALNQSGAKRLVLVSALGVGDTAKKASGFARLIYSTLLRKFFGDKAEAEKALPGFGLDYTVVYPVNLKDSPDRPEAAVVPLSRVGSVPGLPTLPFGSVAKALVEIATDPTTSGEHLLVTTAGGWRPHRSSEPQSPPRSMGHRDPHTS